MMWFKKNKEQQIISEVQKQLRNENKEYLTELSKLLPRKPIKTGVDLYKGYLFDEYACPLCARPVGDEMMIFNYCPSCGQRLDKHDI